MTVNLSKVELSFENDKLSFENDSFNLNTAELSFENDSMNLEKQEYVEESQKSEAAVTSNEDELTEETCNEVITWLNKIISYNLRNDINQYAKQIRSKVQSHAIRKDELYKELELIKETFNSVAAKRKSRR